MQEPAALCCGAICAQRCSQRAQSPASPRLVAEQSLSRGALSALLIS